MPIRFAVIVLGILGTLACEKSDGAVATTESRESGAQSDVPEADTLKALELVQEIRANAKSVAPVDEPEAPATETVELSAKQQAKLDKLNKLEAQMCQCKEVGCVNAVSSDFASQPGILSGFDDEVGAQAQATHDRMRLCAAALESEAMRSYVALIDEVCECRSEACVDANFKKLKSAIGKELPELMRKYTNALRAADNHLVDCLDRILE